MVVVSAKEGMAVLRKSVDDNVMMERVLIPCSITDENGDVVSLSFFDMNEVVDDEVVVVVVENGMVLDCGAKDDDEEIIISPRKTDDA